MDEEFILDEKTSMFEEMMKQQLLIESLSEQTAEVFENVVFEGKKRYYIEDLSERDYFLENTTPYQIQINNFVIEEKSWSNLICKMSKLLLQEYPEYIETILDFRCKWSKQSMYSKECKTNYKMVCEELYVNCNHTALHACWFIQDLLDFFGINKSSIRFLIHRPSGAEPKNVKEYIERRTKRKFKYYLIDAYKKNEEYASKVIKNIDTHLNRMLAKISKSHINFFLFDDKLVLYNYIAKTKTEIKRNLKYNEREKKILNKYLDYILSFYSK